MLTDTEDNATLVSPFASPQAASQAEAKVGRLAKMMRIEWLGQTVASLCWIVSVFVYGITSAGDWLQLGAASAWLVANIAAVVSTEAD
ncbi:MAG: hypothetical protein AAGJ46_08770 [Planctomycetota bacterium]